MKNVLTILSIILFFGGCRTSHLPQIYKDYAGADKQFVKIYFQFGFRNRLDTFEMVFQKDLIEDGVVTVPFWLTSREQGAIRKMMDEIDFFALPDAFYPPANQVVIPDAGDRYLIIQVGDRSKSIRWSYETNPDNPQFKRFSRLCKLLIDIITSKPEYKNLPEAKGYYL